MGLKLNVKIVLCWAIFFVLTYFESYDIGGISFASVWKIPFIAYWIYYTYVHYSGQSRKIGLVVSGGVFCLLTLVHSNMFTSIIPEVTDFTKYIIVPTLFFFLIRKYKDTPYDIVKGLYWLSVFLIWTNIPYLFGFIKPKVQKDYTVSFGESMADNAGFSGPYMTIHAQSVLMASALIFIAFLMYNYPRKFRVSSPFLWVTIGIGLYCLYLSFARTGWLLFGVGMFFVFVKTISFKRVMKSLPFLFMAVLALGYLYLNNDSFRHRLLDQREYSTGNTSDDIGSGRLLMSSVALKNWWESTPFEVFKGYGLEKGRDKMEQKIGLRLFAHNGLVDILQRSGLIGLTLFILFLYSCYKLIKGTRGKYQSLSKGFFWGWLLVGCTQEFTMVYLNVFLASVLAANYCFNRAYAVQRKMAGHARMDLKRTPVAAVGSY